MGEASGSCALSRLRDKMLQDEEGRQILRFVTILQHGYWYVCVSAKTHSYERPPKFFI